MTTKTFDQLLDAAATTSKTQAEQNEAIVAHLLTVAAPAIEDFRKAAEKLSPDLSLTTSVKRALQSIDAGILKDPLTIRVQEKAAAAQAAAQSSS